MGEDTSDSGPNVSGVQAMAHPVGTVTDVSINSALEFLQGICPPAEQELRRLVRDNGNSWRATNAVRVVSQAIGKFAHRGQTLSLRAHPRLVFKILEEGAWVDDEQLQEKWAGLLVSSCCAQGRDDSNWIFVRLLSQLTLLQGRILDYAIANCRREVFGEEYMTFHTKHLEKHEIISAFGEWDFSRLERETLDLRNLDLIGAPLGYGPRRDEPFLILRPTQLAQQLFVRCEGSRLSPDQYFRVGGTD